MTDRDPDPTRVEPVVDQTTVFPAAGPGGPPTAGIPPVFDDRRPPPPPDRRPWIIAAVLALIALLLVLLLVLRDDDDGDVDTSSTSTSEPVTSTSTTTPPSTTAAPTTTSAPATTVAPVVTVPPEECAEAGEGPAQPGLAAETVYDAWVRGDEACAAELMTAPALQELFARDGSGADDQFQGCTEVDEPDPHVDCAYTYEGGSTHYLMRFSDTDGWQVYDISQNAD